MSEHESDKPARAAYAARFQAYDGESSSRRTALSFIALGVLIVVLFVANVCIGGVEVPLSKLPDIFAGHGAETLEYQVIWQIRLPRIIACIVLGGALALSGFLLQTFFNNPIAGPFILGISSGSKLVLAVVMIVVLGSHQALNSWMSVLAAFTGAMIAMGFVMLIAQRVSSPGMLIICGVMVGYICTAVTDFLITFADEQNIVNLYNWAQGSFSGMTWDNVWIMTAVSLISSLLVFLLSKPIGAYQLGENYAQSMGVNIRAFRGALITLSSLLAACVTAFAGPISFVGIAVPHLVRALLGTSKPIRVIPACFLGGAIFCLGCDLIARSLFSPVELSISVVTAIFGAPVVIAVMMRKRRR